MVLCKRTEESSAVRSLSGLYSFAHGVLDVCFFVLSISQFGVVVLCIDMCAREAYCQVFFYFAENVGRQIMCKPTGR